MARRDQAWRDARNARREMEKAQNQADPEADEGSFFTSTPLGKTLYFLGLFVPSAIVIFAIQYYRGRLMEELFNTIGLLVFMASVAIVFVMNSRRK